MGSTGQLSTVLHRPDEVAAMLRCSTWWVKEQARKGRIPYSRIGGGYRFTDEHVAEIVRIFEKRPADTPAVVPSPRRPTQRSTDEQGQTANRLTARVPRRARMTTLDTAV